MGCSLRPHRSGAPLAAALPYPTDTPTAHALVVIVSELSRPVEQVMQGVRQDLPPYMVPARIEVGDIPLNANQKVDRGRLADRIRNLMDGV